MSEKEVCLNCRWFDRSPWSGAGGEVVGACLDRSKIIYPEGTVRDMDNAPGVCHAEIFTCANFEREGEGK